MTCKHGSTSWMCKYCDAETVEIEERRQGLRPPSLLACILIDYCPNERKCEQAHECLGRLDDISRASKS